MYCLKFFIHSYSIKNTNLEYNSGSTNTQKIQIYFKKRIDQSQEIFITSVQISLQNSDFPMWD